jgi:hypothetical protein
MTVLLAVGLWIAAATATATPPGKVPHGASKEMADAIVAVNKALGLESWPQHGVKPCIDRGGQGITAKDVTPEDARKCAEAAVAKGFPGLGKSYVLAILVASIGPVTAIALGTGDLTGWGAYTCDPARMCAAMKMNLANKWGRRLVDRQVKACAEVATLWLPAGQRVCSEGSK